MKSTSKTAHAGFSPLIPAVLAPPEVMTQAPPGFIPPPLNPSGARLETKELAPGVYGLLSSKLPVDNSGFVVGEHGVLVIDAHINGAMAGLIQTAVRRLTVTGKEVRRSIVLILHETGKPAGSTDTKWVPKGLCQN